MSRQAQETSRFMNAKIVFSACAFVTLTLGAVVSVVQPAQATIYEVDGKIRICHATSSNPNSNNPYNSQEVSTNAAGNGNNSINGHLTHTGEAGLVIYSNEIHAEAKADKKDWGDIIPPTDAHPNGLNWTIAGQAVWANGCNYANEAMANVDTEPATCDEGEKLVYGATTNATLSGTANGTFGPGAYSVTATANAGALFLDITPPTNVKVFNGTLAGALPHQQTDPEAPCYDEPGRGGETPETPETPKTPETPVSAPSAPAAPAAPAVELLPNTAGATTSVVVTAAAAFAGILLAAAYAVKTRILARM